MIALAASVVGTMGLRDLFWRQLLHLVLESIQKTSATWTAAISETIQCQLRGVWLALLRALLLPQHQSQVWRQMLAFPPGLTRQLQGLVTPIGGGGFWRAYWLLFFGCYYAAAALV